MQPLDIERQPTRILVVDDEVALAEMIGTALNAEGYSTTICTSGECALETVAAERPAALILDVLMPGVDGFDVLRRLRQTPGGQRIPVILISGAWRPHERQRDIGTTKKIAPTVVLPKPFSLEDLDQTLGMLGLTPTSRGGMGHSSQGAREYSTDV